MAVVHITMDTKRSRAGALLPRDVELNIIVVELFYFACSIWRLRDGRGHPVPDIGADVVIDQIGLSNPFDIWAFLKSIPVGAAKEVADRTIFYTSEAAKRNAEADRARQGVISDKLDNLRKANTIREELLASGHDAESVTALIGQLLNDQQATLDVHPGDMRRQGQPRLPLD